MVIILEGTKFNIDYTKGAVVTMVIILEGTKFNIDYTKGLLSLCGHNLRGY